MFFDKYVAKTDNANREVIFMRVLVAWLGAIVLIQTVVTYSLIGTEKIILVPPEINRSFWVSSNSASSEYLEDMAYWYLGLALNISPSSANYQNERFLKYAAPASSGQLQADMGARADYLKKNSAATQFAVRTVKTDTDNLCVSFAGTLATWVSDKKAADRSANYVICFKFINGKLYVSNFKETTEQDPFGFGVAPMS